MPDFDLRNPVVKAELKVNSIFIYTGIINLFHTLLTDSNCNYSLSCGICMQDVIKFWLDKGLDGLRLDAANYMFEDPKLCDEPLVREVRKGETLGYFDFKHIYTKNHPDNLDFIREVRSFMDKEYNNSEDVDEK